MNSAHSKNLYSGTEGFFIHIHCLKQFFSEYTLFGLAKVCFSDVRFILVYLSKPERTVRIFYHFCVESILTAFVEGMSLRYFS